MKVAYAGTTGEVPGIAGRLTSYTMRQLFEMNIAAYTASLSPKEQSRAAR